MSFFSLFFVSTGKYAFQSSNGNFLSVSKAGELTSRQNVYDESGEFTITKISEGQFSVKTFEGKFLSAQKTGAIECNRTEVGLWETIKIDNLKLH